MFNLRSRQLCTLIFVWFRAWPSYKIIHGIWDSSAVFACYWSLAIRTLNAVTCTNYIFFELFLLYNKIIKNAYGVKQVMNRISCCVRVLLPKQAVFSRSVCALADDDYETDSSEEEDTSCSSSDSSDSDEVPDDKDENLTPEQILRIQRMEEEARLQVKSNGLLLSLKSVLQTC